MVRPRPRRGPRRDGGRPSGGRSSTIEAGDKGTGLSVPASGRSNQNGPVTVGGGNKEARGTLPGIINSALSPAPRQGHGDNVITVGWCTKPFQHRANICPRDTRETRLPKSGPQREKKPFGRPPGRELQRGAQTAASSTQQEPNDDQQQMHAFTKSQTPFGCCCQVSSRLHRSARNLAQNCPSAAPSGSSQDTRIRLVTKGD